MAPRLYCGRFRGEPDAKPKRGGKGARDGGRGRGCGDRRPPCRGRPRDPGDVPHQARAGRLQGPRGPGWRRGSRAGQGATARHHLPRRPPSQEGRLRGPAGASPARPHGRDAGDHPQQLRREGAGRPGSQAGSDGVPGEGADVAAGSLGGHQRVAEGVAKSSSASGPLPGSPGLDKPIYTISVAAEILETRPRTLMVSENMGLVVPQRTTTNRRRFSQRDIYKLQTIQSLTRRHGVNLTGVRYVLALLKAPPNQGIAPPEALRDIDVSALKI